MKILQFSSLKVSIHLKINMSVLFNASDGKVYYTTFAQKSQTLAQNILLLSKVYNDDGGIKYLKHGLPAITGDNPPAKRESSPSTIGQTFQ